MKPYKIAFGIFIILLFTFQLLLNKRETINITITNKEVKNNICLVYSKDEIYKYNRILEKDLEIGKTYRLEINTFNHSIISIKNN